MRLCSLRFEAAGPLFFSKAKLPEFGANVKFGGL